MRRGRSWIWDFCPHLSGCGASLQPHYAKQAVARWGGQSHVTGVRDNSQKGGRSKPGTEKVTRTPNPPNPPRPASLLTWEEMECQQSSRLSIVGCSGLLELYSQGLKSGGEGNAEYHLLLPESILALRDVGA